MGRRGSNQTNKNSKDLMDNSTIFLGDRLGKNMGSLGLENWSHLSKNTGVAWVQTRGSFE